VVGLQIGAINRVRLRAQPHIILRRRRLTIPPNASVVQGGTRKLSTPEPCHSPGQGRRSYQSKAPAARSPASRNGQGTTGGIQWYNDRPSPTQRASYNCLCPPEMTIQEAAIRGCSQPMPGHALDGDLATETQAADQRRGSVGLIAQLRSLSLSYALKLPSVRIARFRRKCIVMASRHGTGQPGLQFSPVERRQGSQCQAQPIIQYTHTEAPPRWRGEWALELGALSNKSEPEHRSLSTNLVTLGARVRGGGLFFSPLPSFYSSTTPDTHNVMHT
jgi:hypothetical protein